MNTTPWSSGGNPDRDDRAWIDLYWLPLGAGDKTRCVRCNGRFFEALQARRQHRPRCDLYHSALEVGLGADRFAIEMAPVWGNSHTDRGVVTGGAVGAPWLGRSRYFRYEVRRWRNGTIPDRSEAVASPQRMSSDLAQAHRVLELAPSFPAATWGRDELNTGDMWNSNSLTAWLLARTGHEVDLVEPPPRGSAPGWQAGVVVATRQEHAQRDPAESRCSRREQPRASTASG
jgi:hypothetical protein